MVSEDKSPLEAALDVFVYGPLGLFITVTEEMPKLVEKGRLRLTSQLGMARMMGEMAAPHLQAEAGKLVRGVVERMSPPGPAGGPGGRSPSPSPSSGTGPRATSAAAGAPAPSPAPSRPTPAAASGPARPAPVGTPSPEPAGAPRKPPASADAGPRPATAGATPSGTSNGSAGASADSTHLAIPGYDTLSAMQVVQRLTGLSPDELDAVAAYEASHRGRKTILHRAEQLRSEPAG